MKTLVKRSRSCDRGHIETAIAMHAIALSPFIAPRNMEPMTTSRLFFPREPK